MKRMIMQFIGPNYCLWC